MNDDIEQIDDIELENDFDGEAARCEAESADADADKPQKPSKAELCHVLDCLTQNPILAAAMRAINRRPNTIFLFAKQSREGNPKYLVRWPDPDGAEVWFHDAITTARSMHLANFEAALRRDVETGVPRVLRNQQGEIVYEVDHLLVAQFENDPDSARALGVKDPFFVHDQKGARVPVIVFDQAPAALRQHVARATLPGYNPAETRIVDNKHSGGVLVVKATVQGDDAAKVIPPYARSRMDMATAKPMSDLQRDLMTRLEDLRAHGPSNPHPTGPVMSRGGSDGDPVERRTGSADNTDAEGKPVPPDPPRARRVA